MGVLMKRLSKSCLNLTRKYIIFLIPSFHRLFQSKALPAVCALIHQWYCSQSVTVKVRTTFGWGTLFKYPEYLCSNSFLCVYFCMYLLLLYTYLHMCIYVCYFRMCMCVRFYRWIFNIFILPNLSHLFSGK